MLHQFFGKRVRSVSGIRARSPKTCVDVAAALLCRQCAHRFSQFGAIKALKAVGLANLVDLYDAGSPCGQVHIRNKTVVGERLADASLALAYVCSYFLGVSKLTRRLLLTIMAFTARYNISTGWNGPVPTIMHFNTTASTGSSTLAIEISFDNAQGERFESSDLAFVDLTWNEQTSEATSQNYEVLLSPANSTGTEAAQWVQAGATVRGAGVVVHAPTSTEADLIGLRYAFADTPRGQQLFSQRQGVLHLPAMPFVANCSAQSLSCTLLQPGQVPALYAQAGAESGRY